VLASTVNSTSEKCFLNIWIPILRAMLDILKTRRNMKKEVVLANLYQNNEDIADKLFILEKIFDVELFKETEQIQLKEEPLAFVQREKYSSDIEDPIIDFLSDFVQKELLNEIVLSSEKHMDISLEVPPTIIFLDNVYMMDKPSWELLDNLKKNCKRIAFVLLIKINPNNQPIFSTGAEDIATEFLSHEDNNDVMIDLSDLEEEELKLMICDLSKQYEIQMNEEINKMTEILNPEKTLKNPLDSPKIRNELIKNLNVADYFTDIQKDVMNIIIQKCEGNPLCSMQFVINLMVNGMTITKDKSLYPIGKKFFD